jgi:hypothetical protein
MKNNTRYRLQRAIMDAVNDDKDGQLSLAAHHLDEMDKEAREEVFKIIGANVCEHIRNEVKPLAKILSVA